MSIFFFCSANLYCRSNTVWSGTVWVFCIYEGCLLDHLYKCILYNVYCILYNVYCMYNVYCIMYIVWCILYHLVSMCASPSCISVDLANYGRGWHNSCPHVTATVIIIIIIVVVIIENLCHRRCCLFPQDFEVITRRQIKRFSLRKEKWPFEAGFQRLLN